jgi:hypothetical protein
MIDTSSLWSWTSLVLLGSFHGLNPAMGWLFAVALGLQERRARAVVTALGPIALGHALSIAIVVAFVWMLGSVLPQDILMLIGGAAMLGFAAYKVATRFRHPRWVGMRVRGRDLVAWSFVMATAHGAGLMLVPALLDLRGDDAAVAVAEAGAHAHQHHMPASDGGSGESLVVSLLAVGLHTVAMLVVAGLVAIVVYKRVGVDVLRRAWINVDLVWIGAIGAVGVGSILLASRSLVLG